MIPSIRARLPSGSLDVSALVTNYDGHSAREARLGFALYSQGSVACMLGVVLATPPKDI